MEQTQTKLLCINILVYVSSLLGSRGLILQLDLLASIRNGIAAVW